MNNWIDGVANVMPLAASLIPAGMTIANLQRRLAFGPVEAWIAGGVVEGLGFVAVTTTLELFEMYQAESDPTQKRVHLVQFAAAGSGTIFYTAVVVLLNALMDEGGWERKIVLGLLSGFALIGGLMVALRNQMNKRLAQIAAEEQAAQDEKKRQEEQAQARRDQAAREEQAARERLAEEQRQERAQRAEERRLDRQAEREARLAEKRIELELLVAGTRGESQKAAEPLTESASKPQRWSALADSDKQRVTEIMRYSQTQHGKAWKKPAVVTVMAEYGLDERQSYKWLEYAERDASQVVEAPHGE